MQEPNPASSSDAPATPPSGAEASDVEMDDPPPDGGDRSDDPEALPSLKTDAAQDEAAAAAAAAATAAAAALRLEGLFDDDGNDDGNDEFAFASSPVKREPMSDQLDGHDDGQPPPPAGGYAGASASDPGVMRAFYQRLFPWRYLFHWLNHGPRPTTDFGHREFAFTLQNDAYLRYQSYPTADMLRKDVLLKMPTRFEIGPVYSTNPRDRKGLRNAGTFRPVSKELCFDIDMTDYDDVRTCCDKAQICGRCWRFMAMAVRVVDAALREDFGFRHILWVYSGRRGAHAWVCDRAARQLDDRERRAVAGYLEVVRGGAQSGKKVNVRRPLHPHLTRSFNMLKEHFLPDVLSGQDPWDTPSRAEKLLGFLPDRALADALRRHWESSPAERSSSERWADIDALASRMQNLDGRALLEAKQDIMLEYTYPRLDIEVSKKLNHLLKSPFVVHPGTGRVCVPMMVGPGGRGVDEFDPLSVPTVQQLLSEIDEFGNDDDGRGGDGDEAQARPVQDWEKTSLKRYVEWFRTFVAALLRDEKQLDGNVKGEGIDF